MKKIYGIYKGIFYMRWFAYMESLLYRVLSIQRPPYMKPSVWGFSSIARSPIYGIPHTGIPSCSGLLRDRFFNFCKLFCRSVWTALYIAINMAIYSYIYIYLYIAIYMCMAIYIDICIYLYIAIYRYIYIYTYIAIYIYGYIYI